MGPSGAGKSTLLHILGMHDSAWTGEYYCIDQPIHRCSAKERAELQKKHIGFVFQSYHLLDNLTVYENLDMPLSYRDVKKQGAPEHGRRHPRPLPDRRQEGSLSEPALGRPAAAGRRGARGHRQPEGDPRRRADRQPALGAGQARSWSCSSALNDEGTTIIQVTHSEVNAVVRQPHHPAAGRLAGRTTDGSDRRRAVASRAGLARRRCNGARILIADDQPDVLEALRLLLKARGLRDRDGDVAGRRPARRSSARDFDVVLMDLNYTRDTTSGQEGLDLLHAACSALDATLPVVVMTAWGSGRRRGRGDAPRRARLHPEAVGQRAAAGDRPHAGRARRARCAGGSGSRPRTGRCKPTAGRMLIAESPAMRPVLELIARVGPSDANVLDHRRERHRQGHWSRRRCTRSRRAPARPLVTVNAGGLSEGVFESELFGHVKGAFTDAKTDRVGRFELADGGTLFLDEIANVPLNQQPKLLRVLETGEFERVGSSRTRQRQRAHHLGDQRRPRRPRSRPAASARICCSA